MIKEAILFILGLVIGDFLSVAIYRLLEKKTLGLSSFCPVCKHRLRGFDLVPVFSYLGLRGRCRYCKDPISLSYPLVELVTGVLTMIWGLRFQADPLGIAILVLTYGLITIGFIDLKSQIIPDRLTIPLIIGGLVFQLWQGDIVTAIIGAIAGGGLLGLIAIIYPPGMGLGDAKLLALIGLFLNWREAFLTLFVSGLLGMIVMLPFVLLKKRRKDQPFPFGPFIIVAAWLVIYLPDSLIQGFFPTY
ncbi:MAG TPA: prepilin peptidase [Bacillota bacterium]|nr:prepilin peptidase [Bacillota bacterium]